ncbi:MAG: hypothetical protein ABI237_16975 [Ginsengibacter sp.]
MSRNIYIRKFFAVVLLGVFALSNTPTKYLHLLFANHKDFVSKTLTDSNTPQLNVTGINCHCESNVVIAPYTPGNLMMLGAVITVFTEYPYSFLSEIILSRSVSFGLRGPPSLS